MQQSGEHVVVGDFNLHHPMWTKPGYEHRHEEADQLVELATETGLELLLPQGTTTYERVSETSI